MVSGLKDKQRWFESLSKLSNVFLRFMLNLMETHPTYLFLIEDHSYNDILLEHALI